MGIQLFMGIEKKKMLNQENWATDYLLKQKRIGCQRQTM